MGGSNRLTVDALNKLAKVLLLLRSDAHLVQRHANLFDLQEVDALAERAARVREELRAFADLPPVCACLGSPRCAHLPYPLTCCRTSFELNSCSRRRERKLCASVKSLQMRQPRRIPSLGIALRHACRVNMSLAWWSRVCTHVPAAAVAAFVADGGVRPLVAAQAIQLAHSIIFVFSSSPIATTQHHHYHNRTRSLSRWRLARCGGSR